MTVPPEGTHFHGRRKVTVGELVDGVGALLLPPHVAHQAGGATARAPQPRRAAALGAQPDQAAGCCMSIPVSCYSDPITAAGRFSEKTWQNFGSQRQCETNFFRLVLQALQF